MSTVHAAPYVPRPWQHLDQPDLGTVMVMHRQTGKTLIVNASVRYAYDQYERRLMRDPEVMLERPEAGLLRYMRHGRV